MTKIKRKVHSEGMELYLDLDGVIYDFHAAAVKHGFDLTDRAQRSPFWKHVARLARNGIGWWSELDFMPGAIELFEFCAPYSPTILTATGRVGNALAEKADRINKDFGLVPFIAVPSGKDKARFAASHRVLVDDRASVIDNWVLAGGVGVLHTSLQDTIGELQKLGF